MTRPDNTEVEMSKQCTEESDRTYLKNKELEKALGIALQATKRLEEMMQAEGLGKEEEEQGETVLEEGKKDDFFTTGKSQQRVIEDMEETEE